MTSPSAFLADSLQTRLFAHPQELADVSRFIMTSPHVLAFARALPGQSALVHTGGPLCGYDPHARLSYAFERCAVSAWREFEALSVADKMRYSPPRLPPEIIAALDGSLGLSQAQVIWNRLCERIRLSLPLVDVNLDADVAVTGSAEQIANANLSALQTDQRDRLGVTLANRVAFNSWVDFVPDHPALAATSGIKDMLDAVATYRYGSGHWLDVARRGLNACDEEVGVAAAALKALEELSPRARAEYIASLHLDGTGLSSYWLRLCSAASTHERRRLTAHLFESAAFVARAVGPVQRLEQLLDYAVVEAVRETFAALGPHRARELEQLLSAIQGDPPGRLAEIAAAFSAARVDFGEYTAADLKQRPAGVGQYWRDVRGARRLPRPQSVATPSSSVIRWGKGEAKRVMNVALALTGGGARCELHIDAIDRVAASLGRSDTTAFVVDEIMGVSGGAITGLMLVAGYHSRSDLQRVMDGFVADDYVGGLGSLLSAGDYRTDALNKTGLFSFQRLYQTLDLMLRRGLFENYGIVRQGPIRFADLPIDFKPIASVVATDLPEAVWPKVGIESTARLVFSKETTPDFDVVAAVLASSAIPGITHLPTIEVAYEHGGAVRTGFLQLADGGLTAEMPHHQRKKAGPQDLLVRIPVAYNTPDGKDVGLFMDFDSDVRLEDVRRTTGAKLDALLEGDSFHRFVTGDAFPAGDGSVSGPTEHGRRLAVVLELRGHDEADRLTVNGTTKGHDAALLTKGAAERLPVLHPPRRPGLLGQLLRLGTWPEETVQTSATPVSSFPQALHASLGVALAPHERDR